MNRVRAPVAAADTALPASVRKVAGGRRKLAASSCHGVTEPPRPLLRRQSPTLSLLHGRRIFSSDLPIGVTMAFNADKQFCLDAGCCQIRPFQPNDRESLVRHANNWRMARNMRDLFPHPYTLVEADKWLTISSQQNPVTKFAIAVDGEAVGGIGLTLQEDVYRRSAEIGYWLGESFWGQGIVTAAVRTFNSLCIRQVRSDSHLRQCLRLEPRLGASFGKSRLFARRRDAAECFQRGADDRRFFVRHHARSACCSRAI